MLGSGKLRSGKTAEGITALALAPSKDVLLAGIPAINTARKAAEKYISEASKPIPAPAPITIQAPPSPVSVPHPAPPPQATLSNDYKWILGALGVGALGIGAGALYKYMNGGEGAKVRVRLPGANGSEVEVPVSSLGVSDAMQSGLSRDVRKKLQKEIKSRSSKVDPMTGKRIPFEEWNKKYGGTVYDTNGEGEVSDADALGELGQPDAEKAASVRNIIALQATINTLRTQCLNY
ncbi:MAG: hypothetical protein RR182_00650 [Alistipes sp.]